jgi:hypothetical protein
LTGLKQARQIGFVSGPAAALVGDGTVPFEAIALQRLQDALSRARLLPGWVDVLDADQPAATMPACLKIAGSCGEQGAEVQWPRG